MNHFQIEKEILEKLNYAQSFIDRLKVELASMIIVKSKKVGVITKDLKEKCLKEFKKEKKDDFKCRFCDKIFSEGRQLGGHVSRAHKGQQGKENISEDGSVKSFALREKGPIRRVRMERRRRQEEKSELKSEKSRIKLEEFQADDSIYMSEE